MRLCGSQGSSGYAVVVGNQRRVFSRCFGICGGDRIELEHLDGILDRSTVLRSGIPVLWLGESQISGLIWRFRRVLGAGVGRGRLAHR